MFTMPQKDVVGWVDRWVCTTIRPKIGPQIPLEQALMERKPAVGKTGAKSSAATVKVTFATTLRSIKR